MDFGGRVSDFQELRCPFGNPFPPVIVEIQGQGHVFPDAEMAYQMPFLKDETELPQANVRARFKRHLADVFQLVPVPNEYLSGIRTVDQGKLVEEGGLPGCRIPENKRDLASQNVNFLLDEDRRPGIFAICPGETRESQIDGL